MTVDSESPALWNEERKRLLELLVALGSSIAGYYREGIGLLDRPAIPAEEKSRISIIGHCFRELMNNLPEALRDVVGVPGRGGSSRTEVNNLLSAFGTLRGESTFPEENPYSSDDPTDPVSVPKGIMAAVVDLVRSENEGTIRGIQRDSMVVLGRLDVTDPALAPWRKARKFFMSFTHLNSGSVDSPNQVSDHEILGHVEIIEGSLFSRLGPFFENYHAIEDILRVANQVEGEG